jgi:hypothetical protein
MHLSTYISIYLSIHPNSSICRRQVGSAACGVFHHWQQSSRNGVTRDHLSLPLLSLPRGVDRGCWDVRSTRNHRWWTGLRHLVVRATFSFLHMPRDLSPPASPSYFDNPSLRGGDLFILSFT